MGVCRMMAGAPDEALSAIVEFCQDPQQYMAFRLHSPTSSVSNFSMGSSARTSQLSDFRLSGVESPRDRGGQPIQ